METKKTHNNLRIVAKILLAILLLEAAGEWIAVCQTYYQLVSPLIPADIIHKIAGPFMLMAIVLSSAALPALILFFYKKDLFVVILCGGAIAFKELYSSFV